MLRPTQSPCRQAENVSHEAQLSLYMSQCCDGLYNGLDIISSVPPWLAFVSAAICHIL